MKIKRPNVGTSQVDLLTERLHVIEMEAQHRLALKALAAPDHQTPSLFPPGYQLKGTF